MLTQTSKFLNYGLMVTLMLCYVDIPKGEHEFLGQTVFKAIPHMFTDTLFFGMLAILLGALLYLFIGTMAEDEGTYKRRTVVGLWCSGIICFFFLLVHFTQWLSLLSALPFLTLFVLAIRNVRRIGK